MDIISTVFWSATHHDSEFFSSNISHSLQSTHTKLVAHHSNCLVLKILFFFLLPVFSTLEFSMFMCMYVGGILATKHSATTLIMLGGLRD